MDFDGGERSSNADTSLQDINTKNDGVAHVKDLYYRKDAREDGASRGLFSLQLKKFLCIRQMRLGDAFWYCVKLSKRW
jgi:hypothetical protein